ncbi:hypothetical protein DFH11DRAFT_278524 [Phellopilus nigrolimitatus]|nr:hypothetical protein DFH11DRAFT_278524 [Phellopilus nigrolimitatus]
MSPAERPAEDAGAGAGSGPSSGTPVPPDAPPAYSEKRGGGDVVVGKEEEREEEEAEDDDDDDDDDGDQDGVEGKQETAVEETRSGAHRWRRLLALLALSALLCFALAVLRPPAAQPKVVYANRYSKEHRFRPAASPIVTERLKDGRTRLRGAQPTRCVFVRRVASRF